MAEYEWMQGNSAGPHTAPVTKVLIHDTEGGSIEGACAAYENSNSWPHLTVEARFGKDYRVCGHLNYDVAARSLRNVSGGVETNTAGVIQIEVVGYATKPQEIDWAWIGSELVGPICREFGIPVQSSVDWVAYPASYGQKAPQRLKGQQWLAYSGVLGHQHAPENDHGDPGAIPINVLLAGAQQETDMPLTQSDLNAIKSIVQEVTSQRLPLIIADDLTNEWYCTWGNTKVQVTKPDAEQLVAEGSARYWPGMQAIAIPHARVVTRATLGVDDPDV